MCKDILTEILLTVGETRKGVSDLELSVSELRTAVYDVSKHAMRRDECALLQEAHKDPAEKSRTKLHRTISTIAGIAAIIVFIASSVAIFVKADRYITQLSTLQKQTDILIKNSK